MAIGEPRFDWDAIPLAYPMDTAPLPLAWDEFAEPMAVNVGNPHLVFFVDAIDEARLAEVGPRIEHDAVFPERINVNVASIADGVVTLRTWERGAGLTLACGTGACATAVAAIVQQARDLAGAGRDEGRRADHRLGAGRAGAHARRRDPCISRQFSRDF